MSEMTGTERDMDKIKASGSGPWYAGFAVALGVSVDTSWRYFGDNLHIIGRERWLLFAVVEVMLLAAAWSMRASVRRGHGPGSARLVAYFLLGVQAYMAVELSGPAEGLARVVLGSGLALVALHQALGIEMKVRTGVRGGTLARVGRELRERALSRLGLADDARDARQRSRERAAERAARIATTPGGVAFQRARLARAVRAAGVATDPAMKAVMLAHVAAYGNLGKLMELELDSPWTDAPADVDVDMRPSRPVRLPSRPTSGGPAIAWDVDKVVTMLLENASADEVMAATAVTAKTVQRVRRVLQAAASDRMAAEVATGGMSVQYVQKIMAARDAAMAKRVEI